VNGTVYEASGAVTFADPTRTAAAATATPSGTFAAGGTVPGTNYAATSSPLENVTIVDPLPVELSRFDVLALRQDALLTWSTASEHNNDHFTIERSLNGSNFVEVGTVRGQGNSQRPTDYTFTDNGAGRLAAATVYYRLKQVDLNGTASYSPVRTVQFASATAQATAILYPNPSQGQTVVDPRSLAAGTYSVQLLDLAGRVLRTQQSVNEAFTLDIAALPQGAYIVLVQGAGVRQSLRLLRN
ncbi:MAG: T9SS type A sorting domain-containing protein, partial [Hymenobacter sp.]